MDKIADFVKDKDECIYCGSRDNIQMDHVKPKSKGGVTVVPACQECNLSKSDKTLLAYCCCWRCCQNEAPPPVSLLLFVLAPSEVTVTMPDLGVTTRQK